MKKDKRLLTSILCFIILSIIKGVGIQRFSLKILIPILLVSLVLIFWGANTGARSIAKQERKFIIIFSNFINK